MDKSSDLPNLDLLRAGAVLMVFFDHTFQAVAFRSVRITWLGRLGVLFFFVHTCCVLMMSLERQMESGRNSSLFFYTRRFFRVYPLSVVAVAAAYLYRPHALSVIDWLSNFALVQNLTNSPDAFGGIWSLPIEIQMYVFLPGLFLLTSRFRSAIPIFGLWILFCAVALAQQALTNSLTIFTFAPCFIPGVLAWWLFSRVRPLLPAWTWPVLLIILIAAFELGPNWHLSAWLVCLTLGTAMPFFAQISNSRFNHGTLILAKYSYGIYLGHSVLLLWMSPTYAALPLYLVAVGLIAWLGFVFVEQPMINLGRRVTLWKVPAPVAVI